MCYLVELKKWHQKSVFYFSITWTPCIRITSANNTSRSVFTFTYCIRKSGAIVDTYEARYLHSKIRLRLWKWLACLNRFCRFKRLAQYSNIRRWKFNALDCTAVQNNCITFIYFLTLIDSSRLNTLDSLCRGRWGHFCYKHSVFLWQTRKQNKIGETSFMNVTFLIYRTIAFRIESWSVCGINLLFKTTV